MGLEVGDRVWVAWTVVEGMSERPPTKRFHRATIIGLCTCPGCKKDAITNVARFQLRVDRYRWYHLWRPVVVASITEVREMTVLEALADIVIDDRKF
jgi:hypothetical protein